VGTARRTAPIVLAVPSPLPPQRLPTSYFPVASLRAAVVPGFEERLYVPRDRQLQNATLLTGIVTGVDAEGRTVTYTPAAGSGAGKATTVPYDILVLATGITYAAPAHSVGATVAEGKVRT